MNQKVPAYCQLEFERYVSEICDQAKLDYDRRPLVAHELLTHLDERWRHWSSQGKTDSAAKEATLSEFGGVYEVAASLRDPLLKRFLTYKSERGNRFVFFLMATTLVIFTQYVLQAFQMIDDAGATIEYSGYIIGGFINPVISVIYFATFHKYPRNKVLSVLSWSRHIFFIPALLSILNITIIPLVIIYFTLQNDSYEPSWDILAYGIANMLGWIAAAGIISTLIKIPEKRSYFLNNIKYT